MDLFTLISSKMIYFFLLMALGFFLGRIRLIPKDSLPTFSRLIVRVLLPALQVSLVFRRGTTFLSFAEKSTFVLLQLGAYVLLTIGGVAGAWLLRLRFPQRNSFRGGMIGGNVGFLLVPLILSVFPEDGGQAYIPLLVSMDVLYVWTVGLYFYMEGTGAAKSPRAFLKRLFGPMLVGILLALTLTTLHVPIPEQILEALDAAGAASGTLGLIILGVNIYYMDRHLSGSLLPMLGFIGIRQILIPLLTYVIALPIAGRTESVLLMLLSAVPTMTTTSLLAIEYRTDVNFASGLVFLSTVLSMATIPLVTFIISFI